MGLCPGYIIGMEPRHRPAVVGVHPCLAHLRVVEPQQMADFVDGYGGEVNA